MKKQGNKTTTAPFERKQRRNYLEAMEWKSSGSGTTKQPAAKKGSKKRSNEVDSNEIWSQQQMTARNVGWKNDPGVSPGRRCRLGSSHEASFLSAARGCKHAHALTRARTNRRTQINGKMPTNEKNKDGEELNRPDYPNPSTADSPWKTIK